MWYDTYVTHVKDATIHLQSIRHCVYTTLPPDYIEGFNIALRHMQSMTRAYVLYSLAYLLTGCAHLSEHFSIAYLFNARLLAD